ncbi:hypothetical protein BCV70DRAFT_175373 [Testicularia cyperi]|uniref:C2H2-type domain-containing protein n=1 Tax=Testicularia cyperi TaxID=1882483 RepID=A0A317XQ51_9BASI|nr:hypothetical protein BCV70DRAFT_175373 [Testicularia cyperi]
MSQPKDFVLFDDPAPSLVPTNPIGRNPSGSTANPVAIGSAPIGSFSKHRSPRQLPYVDDPLPASAASIGSASDKLPGTLDDAGSPRRKRQRSQVYASSMPRSSREGTFGSSEGASTGRVSPRDPPSGSLGAPMHDLSLTDSMPSRQPQQLAAAQMSPATAGMTVEQQERVKAQIRAELAGVDSRAFKGPLRDILQKQDYTPKANDMQTSPLSAASDPMQAGVAPSFSLFPDYDVGGGSSSQPNQTGRSPSVAGAAKAGVNTRSSEDRSPTEEDMPSSSQRSTDSRGRGASTTFDAGFGAMSYPPARNSQSYLPDWARQSQGSQSQQQHHQPQPSHQQRPQMPPPSQNMSQGQLNYRGGPVSMGPAEQNSSGATGAAPPSSGGGRRALKRESSGLTVSPQEAFLDYDDVENALSHSGLGKMPSLFAPVPPGLSDAKHGTAARAPYLAGVNGGSGSNTPRSQQYLQAGRARSSTEDASLAAAHRVPMSRNDTARPHHYQKRSDSVGQQTNSDGRGSASQESGSQSSLFSPADSGDTISTDDDEDERPYAPPGMRPSMIRGGPSSLYLNYPAAKGSSPMLTTMPMQRPPLGKERTSSTGSGAWAHVKNEPWAFRQAHLNQPRFSDVSASSSDSEDDRGLRRANLAAQHAHPHSSHLHHAQHHRQAPYPTHGLQRPSLPHHKSSSEDYDDTADNRRRYSYNGSRNSRMHMPGVMGGYGYIPGSQESGLSTGRRVRGEDGSRLGSQDEGSISPSIRSSAQVISRKTLASPPRHALDQGRAAASAVPLAHVVPTAPRADDRIEASGEEEDSEGAEGSGSEEEDEEESDSTATKPKPKSKTATSNANATGASSHPAPKATAGMPGTTKCDYTSPVTGITCQTAFHRPYDLARHRETIHAREEAGFIREGRLKLDDCVVLGKEVDPQKSMAVVEWKCKTCGASFSRKDAMLRHERLRHNAAK